MRPVTAARGAAYWRTVEGSWARKDVLPQRSVTASRRFVFPCPLAPTMKFNRGWNSRRPGARFRNDSVLSERISTRLLHQHRHHDVQVAPDAGNGVGGTPLTLGLLVLHEELDFLRLGRFQELLEVPRIETESHRRRVVGRRDLLVAFADVLALGGDDERPGLEREADGLRPVSREERDAPDGSEKLLARDQRLLVAFLADALLVVGEAPLVELREEATASDGKADVVAAPHDRHRFVVSGVELAELVENLLADENRLEAGLGLGALHLDEREAVAVGGDHLDTGSLDAQERALELKAHLLRRDR